MQMPSIVSMEHLPQASVGHVLVDQKICVMTGAKGQQCN
jgi:hypothetical protein